MAASARSSGGSVGLCGFCGGAGFGDGRVTSWEYGGGMTEAQLLAFLSADEAVQDQLQQLLVLGARLHLDVISEEIVMTGPRIGQDEGELARVPYRPETSPAERQFAARLLLINANRMFMGRLPVSGVTPAEGEGSTAERRPTVTGDDSSRTTVESNS